MGGENISPRTAWKLQWARVLIHWKVMQLKVALRINSQPNKNRIVTQKKANLSIAHRPPPSMIEHSNVNYVTSTTVLSMQKKFMCFEKLGSAKRELHDINTDANLHK